MKANYYFYLASRTNKDNTKTVRLAVVIGKKKFDFYTPIKVLPKHWNAKQRTVRTGHFNWRNDFKLIEYYKSKLAQLNFKLLTDKSLLNKDKLKQFIFGVDDEKDTFFDFAVNEIEKDKTLNKTTKKRYKTSFHRFNKLFPGIKLNELTETTFKDYLFLAQTELNLKQNTFYKDLAIFKKYLNIAINKGLIYENPAKNLKVKRFPGKREYLTETELKKLLDLYENGQLDENKQNVLQYFLFSCFTGLRYSDIKTLKWTHLKKELVNDNEIYFIEKEQEKTKDRVLIPLSDLAKKLLPQKTLQKANVFNVFTNQYTNRALKSIMKLAGIEKKITFHSARHTYATLLINNNVNLSVVQKLVGHKDLKTTQIYAKILKNSLLQSVEVINNKFL